MRYPLLIWCAWVGWVHVLALVADSKYTDHAELRPPPPVVIAVDKLQANPSDTDSPSRLEIRVRADRAPAEDLGIPVTVLRRSSLSGQRGERVVASTTLRMAAGEMSANASLAISECTYRAGERLLVSLETSSFVRSESAEPWEAAWRKPARPPSAPAPMVSWMRDQVSVGGDAGYVELSFELSSPPAVDIRYQVERLADPPLPARSVTVETGRVAPEELVDVIRIPIVDNPLYEPDSETYLVRLLECPGLHVGKGRLELTIVDDQRIPELSLRLSADTVREGDEQPVELTAVTSVASVRPIVVRYECTPESTAVAGEDFEVLDGEFGEITIPATRNEGSVRLQIRDDPYYNGPRTAKFRIADSDFPSDPEPVELLIEDDEPLPTLVLEPQVLAPPGEEEGTGASEDGLQPGGGSFVIAVESDQRATLPIRLHYELSELGSLVADDLSGPEGFDPTQRSGVLELPPKTLQGAAEFQAMAEDTRFHGLPEEPVADRQRLTMRVTRLENARLAPAVPEEFSWRIEDRSLKEGQVMLIVLATETLRSSTEFRNAVGEEVDRFVSQHGTQLLDGRAFVVGESAEGLDWPSVWEGPDDLDWEADEFLKYEPLSEVFTAALRWIQPAVRQAELGEHLRFLIVWPCDWDTADLIAGDAPPPIPPDADVRVIWLGTPEHVGRRSQILDDWFGRENWEPLREPDRRLKLILEKHLPPLLGTTP